MKDEDEPELNDKEFSENLRLDGITFTSDSLVDFYFNENSMFGNHSLVAQSFDGENFEHATMF